MTAPPLHHVQVLSSPWPGVYGTVIESGLSFGKHSHATHGLGLIEVGAQTSASGRGVVDAQAGDLISTNPGEVHDGKPRGGRTRRWKMVYFEPAVLASMALDSDTSRNNETRNIEITQPVMQDAVLTRALHRLFAQLEAWASVELAREHNGSPSKLRALACEEALVQTCALLLNAHTDVPTAARALDSAERGETSKSHVVNLMRQRLADDLLNPPTLAELAALVGLSKYQVLRHFQKAHGLPPHAWLMWQRTERARGLIRSGMTLVDAAAASGFADQSHLHRCFVRHFGFTPGAWQRAFS
jgi:AraC-like DNA-binding protein